MNKKLASGLVLATAGLGLYAMTRSTRTSPDPFAGIKCPRIAILGAGFAGLTAARHLAQRLGVHGRITLVDRHNYHLFTPLLYQAATCGIDPYDAAYPVREFAARHGVAFRRGTVTRIDWDARRVLLDNGALEYDYLVVALGTTTNFFGNASAQQHALPMKHLEDGIAIRNHVIDALDQAAITSDPEARQSLLTFVVVGGGATGVETAAALQDLLRQVLQKDYGRLDPSEARVLLIESEHKLLGHMSERMADIALRRLRPMGVEVWLNARAKEVTAGQVTTEDGRTVHARTIVWTTGVRVPEVVAQLDAPHGKGGSLAVDEYLQVRDHPGIYAIGDNSHFEDSQTHQSVPLLAQAALDEGAAVAENLGRAIEGQPQVPFHYHELGNVVALGHRGGAAEIGGVTVDGLAGWLAWRLIHLAKITSFRNKVATTLDWTVGYLYNEDIARLEVEPVGRS